MNDEYISCLPFTSTAVSMEFDHAASTNSLPEMPSHNQDAFQHQRLHPDITISQEPILNITDNVSEAAIVDHSRTSQEHLGSQIEIDETQFMSSSSEKVYSSEKRVQFAPRPNSSGQELPDDGSSSNDNACSLPGFFYGSQEVTQHLQHPEISTTQEQETNFPRNVFEMAVNEQPGSLNIQFDSYVDLEIDDTPQFVPLCSEKLEKCRVLNRNNDEEDDIQFAPRPLSPEVVLLPHNDQELSDDECMQEHTLKPSRCSESQLKPEEVNENLYSNIDEDVAFDFVSAQASAQNDQPLNELQKYPIAVVEDQEVTERLSVSSNHDIAKIIFEAACSFRSPLQKWIQPFPPPDVNGSFARLSPPEQATAFQRIILTALHSLYCSDLICPIDNCKKMKDTVLHGPCELEGNSCPVWYCSTVNWMWDHYIDCSDKKCRYCYPINLAEDLIVESRHPLRQIAERIILHRLALGQPPVCDALCSIPMYTNNWYNKLCRWHCRCVRRYSLRKGQHYDYHQIRTTVTQNRNQTLYNHCNRRNYSMLSSCTMKNFLLAKYELIKLERSLLILTYMLIPCVKGVCQSLCKCRPFPSGKIFADGIK